RPVPGRLRQRVRAYVPGDAAGAHLLPGPPAPLREGPDQRGQQGLTRVIHSSGLLLARSDARHSGSKSARRVAGETVPAVEQGDQVVRYGWADVMPDPCPTAAQMARLLQAAGWRGTPKSCGRSKCVINELYGGRRPYKRPRSSLATRVLDDRGRLWVGSGRPGAHFPPTRRVGTSLEGRDQVEVVGDEDAVELRAVFPVGEGDGVGAGRQVGQDGGVAGRVVLDVGPVP